MRVLFVGLMVAYALDVKRAREGALGVVWCALIATFTTLGFGGRWITPGVPGVINFLALALHGGVLTLVGLWATLQFRWVHHAHPPTAAACEWAIFTYAPLACGTVIAWAFVTSMDTQIASLYVALSYIAMHRLFMFPIIADCKGEDETAQQSTGTKKRRPVVTSSDAKSVTIAMMILPLAFYVVSNFWDMLADLDHVFACLMLLTFPVLYLICTGTERSLWWLDKSGLETIETLILVAACVIFVAGFEVVVLYAGFSEYIQVPAPLSYMMVTVSVYSALAVFLAHYTDAIGSVIPASVMQGALTLSSFTGMIAMGTPTWMLPLSAIGSVAFVRYYMNQHLADFATFACCILAWFAWFLVNHFWGLDIVVGGILLSQLCLWIIILAISAIALPFVLKATRSIRQPVIGATFVCYVALLAAIEQVLSHTIHDDGSTLYPPYLVIATSVLGTLASRSLVLDGRLTKVFGWLAQGACVTKLSMLLVPRWSEMLSVFIVFLAMSAPYVKLYQGSRQLVHRMSGAHCIAYAVVLVLSLLFARFAMFDIIFELTGHRPTDAILFGGLLLITGMALVPVTANAMGDESMSKRLVMLFLASGVFLISFRPPLPWKGEIGLWYDAEHVPDSEDFDALINDPREHVHHGWPSWLLMLAILAALFAVSSPREHREWTSALRIAFSAICGGCVGLYMALEYFPEQVSLSLMLILSCAFVGVFLSFTYVPSKSSFDWLPYVYSAHVAILMAAYFFQTGGFTETFEENDNSMESKFGIISVFAGTSLQIAFALKFRIRSTLERHVRRKRVAMDSPFLPAAARNRPEHFRNVSSRSAHREMRAQAVAWMPIVGNVATLMSFMACVMLSEEFSDNSPLTVFLLAPILLLLHQDALMFTILEDAQRYAPPLAVIVAKLCYDAVVTIAAGPNTVHVLTSSASSWPWIVSNMFALTCASVNSINLVHYLATGVRTSSIALVVTAPLGILAPLFSKIVSVRALALASAVAAGVQYIMQRRTAVAGLKYL